MTTDRTKVRRNANRGVYDRETINSILDSNFLCHVAFTAGHGPVVLPTLYGRDGDTLYLHGSAGAQMLRTMKRGAPVSVAVTRVNGIVVARSHFHHSINYRSVVIFGLAIEVTDVEEKMHGLKVVTNHILPGRWDEARRPNTVEFTQTLVLKLPINEASAKVRIGPPNDEPEDMDSPIWAGVLPVRTHIGAPVPDPKLSEPVPLPSSLAAARERFQG
jgi:nitroimidazol reductase NimA-like FMN-containing flavoprotein (pyridoxamine 5'-phosphate oxidase superfamily)